MYKLIQFLLIAKASLLKDLRKVKRIILLSQLGLPSVEVNYDNSNNLFWLYEDKIREKLINFYSLTWKSVEFKQTWRLQSVWIQTNS